MGIKKEDINWLIKQVSMIDEHGTDDTYNREKSAGVHLAKNEFLSIISRLEGAVDDNKTSPKHRKVFTAAGYDPINLDENVNEFLTSDEYKGIIDIQWSQVVHPKTNQVIFYAHIFYTN